MAYRIRSNIEMTEAGPLCGHVEPIACDCWFTSRGQGIPRLIKYQDPLGEIHTVTGIQVERTEKKYRCGAPVVEYRCRAAEGGQSTRPFLLVFYPEDGLWKLMRMDM